MATNADKKLVRSKSGLRIVATSEDGRSPFELYEPPWVPDKECHECMKCSARFDFMKRRHHCRRCGKCFCDKCCTIKIALPRMCFVDPVRVCDTCAAVTRKENEFFDKHLKTLTNGADFFLSGSTIEENNEELFFCKISQDQRTLQFEGEHGKHEPVELSKVDSVQILTSSADDQASPIAIGLSIKYKDRQSDQQFLRMSITNLPNKKASQLWTAAMQKGARMLYESKSSETT
ncbi:zinc finger FYVE domain-containing protein 21-like [Lingula anatina]|uniref:Zinc finger FYVE domain-containing protein 21-like n=1 Tax=Lingula anatina TaxID=7574 RepID=A0A1S3JRM7_LINAN|nr:zinc finger FYVE domain-containing protein 21-like [Lingula anatina]|eukprot:XP_013412746.1 zinc finger FYVE domain-containing protein 21-like [Lingula anatina]